MADPTANIPAHDLGLTPVHMAVLRDDTGQLFALINSREHGIDALDSRRATPIMLAAIAGRPTAFTYLLENGASRQRQDSEGLKVADYLLPDSTERLAQIYQPYAPKRFSERRRKYIRATLKALGQTNRQEDSNAVRTALMVEPTNTTTTPAPVAAPVTAVPGVEESPVTELQQETREIIVCQNNLVMFGAFSIQAKAAFTKDLPNKTMGAIRGRAPGSPFHVMTISGWQGDKAEGITVLDNSKYSLLVKAITKMYGYPLYGNPLDYRYQGTPEEKKGMYNCCHSERQLATWLVEECIFRVLGTKSITIENVSKLSQKIDALPADLRETVIELGHTPCRYCINYVKLLQRNSGLVMTLKSRAWFVKGKRTVLRMTDDSVKIRRHQDPLTSSDFVNELGDDEIEDVIQKGGPNADEVLLLETGARTIVDLSEEPGSLSLARDKSNNRRLMKRARKEQRDVDTRRFRTGPPERVNPFEPASASSDADNGYSSSPPPTRNNSTTSSVPGPEGSHQSLMTPLPLPLPLMHKRRRASTSSIVEAPTPTPAPVSIPIPISSSSSSSSSRQPSSPSPSPAVTSPANNSQEREGKRQRRLVESFKNVIIEFAHVSSDPVPAQGLSEQQAEDHPPEGFLESLTVTEPFPGALAFGTADGEK